MITDIGGFLVCALVITFGGTQLSKQGNKLAGLTGLSKAWIGLTLMATVTSLPELVTGLSAVAVVDAPNLAAGNILGSCAFNLLILSMLDLMVKRPITSLVKSGHVIAGSFSIILLALVATAILLAPQTPSILWVSPFSPLLMVVYLIAVRGIFLYEKSQSIADQQKTVEGSGNRNGLRRALFVYTIHAIVVISAALFLPFFGERIAKNTGLSDSFFGTVFLAITTSLPELVISVSAVRIASLDMAMGNLLGSNVFNMAILALVDLFYVAGPLYSGISATHLISILASVMMTAVVAVGLTIHPKKKRWRLSVDTWVILMIYVLSLLLLR